MKPKKKPVSLADVNIKMTEIGEKLRMIRKERYSNYEDFALTCNINKVTVNKIERGENVSLRLFIYTIQQLEISLEDFFKGL
jgi:transcriptional regulator with XRE-family HTH domain